MKVGFISLGCSKNLVDTEMMIGLFRDKNYEIVSDPKIAEVSNKYMWFYRIGKARSNKHNIGDGTI